MKYPLSTDYEDDEFHLAHTGPFVLMNWRGEYRTENFNRLEAVHHRLAQYRKEGVTGISVVEAGSPIPGDAVRHAGSDMMTRTAATTKAVVIIFLDQGFTASALQSVAARELSMGGRVPMKFFHDLTSAASWLTELYPKLELSSSDFEEILQNLRITFSPSRLPAPPPTQSSPGLVIPTLAPLSSNPPSSGSPASSSQPPASDLTAFPPPSSHVVASGAKLSPGRASATLSPTAASRSAAASSPAATSARKARAEKNSPRPKASRKKPR